MPRFLPRRFTKSAQIPDQVQAAMTAEGLDFGSPFSPGTPLTPYSGFGGDPRRWAFDTGYNILTRADRDKRVSFDVLKGLIDNYDIARMAIGHRIDDVRSLNWTVVPKRGNSSDAETVVDQAYGLLRYPEGPGSGLPFRAWLAKYLEDVLRYDAGCLFRRRNRGGQVIGLKVVSGRTIAPTLDYWGDTPVAPAPAFVQFIDGMPWKWFTADDILYVPFRPQPDSPYGFAPLESVLLTANTDLRFQMHFLQWFTSGTVPDGFAVAPEDLSSPDQLQEWQQYWDALLYGDDAAKHQIKWVPNGTTFDFPAIKTFDPQFPLYLMRKVCAAYHVTPNDLGFTEDVNRATGDTQVDVQFRIGTLPLVQHIEDLLTAYLQDDRGLPVEFQFDTGQEKEDRVATAQAHKIYVEMGAESIDEVRSSELGLEVDNERPTPRFVFDPRTGPVPLASLFAIAGPVDPETAAPLDTVPLSLAPFDGAHGLLPDKSPGGTQFQRAPINPDEPGFPELEKPVPGSDVVGTRPGAPVIGDVGAAPVAKDATDGVSSGTGIVGYDLDGHDDEDDDGVDAELVKFARFAKARRRAGKWRDFDFTHLDPIRAHRLNDEQRAEVRKATGDLIAAGLCVRAADSGRVLMLQRAFDPTDPASGMWEFPGGHIEDGETPFAAAWREWQEETGCLIPADATVGDVWAAGNGIYQGHIVTVPSEGSVPIGERGAVINPDDPDGDGFEAIAWWSPDLLTGNPAVRAELAGDLPLVLEALAPSVVVKASDASPKVSWRDGAPKTPQHQYDLRLTDHYAPQVTAALQQAFPVALLRQAVEAARSSLPVVKSAPETDPATQAVRDAAKEALQGPDSTALDTLLRALWAEAFATGQHSANQQLGPNAVTTGGVEVDWSAWQPGDLGAAIAADSGGLATLLADAGVTVDGVTGSLLDQLGNRIADGLLNGDSVDTIANSLSGIVSDPSRAEMIAHTETARAQTAATLDTYQANGVDRWDWILSDNACPECEEQADGNPHDVDEPQSIPLHPRCRCAVAPADPIDSAGESEAP
jgi:SPP1 gp7 family putative phage head morphogenesis protein